MEPTVLAGAIEFSPAEIALILLVVSAIALVVSAPGWVAFGWVMGRRAGPSASSQRRWLARIGGALLGMAVSGVAASMLSWLLDPSIVIGVVGAWLVCWGLAYLLWPRSSSPTAAPDATQTDQGWGRG